MSIAIKGPGKHQDVRTTVLLAIAVSLGAPVAAQAGQLRVINKTREPIAEIQVSHGRDWGPGQLEGRPIRFGEDRLLRWVSDGKHKIRLINQRREECVIDGIDFEDGKVLTVTDRVLTLCE
ncbi:hypothetical protein [Alsobacter soli]|uniref:hypothetical protein n=1 Tax=Alsobacter soli TaxID=2109933 RepID=UPI0011B1CBB3|nr:hypothetical protein [Alsobacter soli]